MLPDDVLLEIFDFYVDEDSETSEKRIIEEWITLAHVCRRWRSVVFQSPLRLNLRLYCTPETPARKYLDNWPPLPLIVYEDPHIFEDKPDNIIAALEHNDRVCRIKLINLSSSQMEHVTDSAVMQKPFPELTNLHMYNSMVVRQSWSGRPQTPSTAHGLSRLGPILPDSFLGGTAPRLRSLRLTNIPFPALPKLLLSATHIVDLILRWIPRSGYFPPKAMAVSLSALTSLEFLCIHFKYPSPPALESRRPSLPPLTRSILPSLTKIRFKGSSEYLEEILARIDAPRLHELHISFFNQIIFDAPQLFQFISRRPTLRAPETGHIEFHHKVVAVRFPSQASDYGVLGVQIPCTGSDWQLSSLEQVCSSSLPPASTLEDLYILEHPYWPPSWQDDVENTQWLQLLRPFAVVKNLYLCKEFVPRIAPALQELVGGRTTEVLPSLENTSGKRRVASES
jgi:F-box-like